MANNLALTLAIVMGLAAGCTADGTQAGDTDTDTDGTDTSSSSSSTPSNAETSSSSTTDDPMTTSGIGGSGGSTGTGDPETTGGATSTGCAPGTEDCECDADACDKGLECNERGVCVPIPVCVEEDSEPNDDEDSAPFLGELNDSSPAFQEVEGAVDGAAQEDWFNWRCDDTPIGQFEMNHEIVSDVELEVCMYLECDIENNMTLDCPEDSTPDTSPLGRLGCCTTEVDSSIIEFDCSDNDNDDSGEVFVRVHNPAEDECVDYVLGFHC